MRHRRREGGFVAAELVLGIGLLLFPVAMLVLTLPTWSERQAAGRAIAREVGRTATISGSCDERRAEIVAGTMSRNLGLRADDVAVDLECTPGRLPRGGELTVNVTVRLPAVSIPGITDVGEWHWTVKHTQPIDPYRSFDDE